MHDLPRGVPGWGQGQGATVRPRVPPRVHRPVAAREVLALPALQAAAAVLKTHLWEGGWEKENPSNNKQVTALLELVSQIDKLVPSSF